MDKLTRYNQKILAIIGTCILAITALSLIGALIAFVFTFFEDNQIQDSAGINVETEKVTYADTTTVKRTHEISFNPPVQLDTSTSKYIMSVGQVMLHKSKKVSYYESAPMEYITTRNKFNFHEGLFNNFIFLDYEKGICKKIFDVKAAISSWTYVQMEGVEVILFQGATTDSNKDKHLDKKDNQELFAYYIKEGQLVSYVFEGKTVQHITPLNKTNLVSIELKKELDQKKYGNRYNPKEIQFLNVHTKNLQEVIPLKLATEIQKIVDGL